VNVRPSFAEAGIKTLLIDGDLRNPRIDQIFGLGNSVGLAPLLNEINKQDSLQTDRKETQIRQLVHEHIQPTQIANLCVMTSGLAGNEVATALLGFHNLQYCLDSIQNEFDFDVIFVDTPPAMTIADSYIMAATTKANIIMVVENTRTNREAVAKTRDQYVHLGNTISGVILNKA
jgi:capsular exopolysaccharide synthesis family protein